VTRLALLLALTACAAPQRPGPASSWPPPQPPPPAEGEAAAEPSAEPPPPPPPAVPVATHPIGRPPHVRRPTAAEIDLCVAETNRYRAQAHKPPLAHSAALDAFAQAGAEMDYKNKSPHGHFNSTTYPEPFSGLAENELPWWHLDPQGGVELVLRSGLASMWAEGPGGGHYENLVGPFTEMGCGIYIVGDEITVTQDFRSP
jgi:uncharacterized protein YkwD